MNSETNRPAPTIDTPLDDAIERRGRYVLEIDGVQASLDPSSRIAPVSFAMTPGSFELMDAGDRRQATAFSDLCSGLIPPTAGTVRFLGHDWTDLPYDYANALRGRIGRVFAGGAWIPHLSLMDNILMQQRHHTRRAEDDLLAEASALAREFGLPGIPLSRPDEATALDRARAALVRAFIGNPALVLLEHPLQGRFVDLLERLVNVIGNARRRGAAVLWLTLTPAIWAMRGLPTSGRIRLSGTRLVRTTS